MKYFSERPVCSYREPVFAWSLHSLTATWRAKNDILFLTFWKSFSTPVPHGFEAKSKHRAEIFLLLLYRNIQSKKVNTALKLFPLLLNSHMRCLENDVELRLFRKVPLLSYRNIGGRKNDIDFWKFSKNSQISGISRLKAQKERLPLFRSRRSLGIIQFYFTSRSSSSLTSSVGLPPARSLFRKASIAAVNSRRSPAQSTRTRSLFIRPNMAAPQQ